MNRKFPRKKRRPIKSGEILDERDPKAPPRKYGEGGYGRRRSTGKNPGR